MKKILAILLAAILCMGLFACGKGNEENQANASGDVNLSGEKAWTVKSATYTYPNGETTVTYGAE